MTHLIMTLMVWISVITGYKMPEKLPGYVVVPHHWFVANMCAGEDTVDAPCFVVALYNPYEKIIFMDAALEGEERDNYLVHELTHYMQDYNGTYPSLTDPTCAERIDAEEEAYRTQNKYIMQAQHDKDLVRLPSHHSMCHPH